MKGFPQVQTFGSHFQLLMTARNQKGYIVRFSADESDAGLYLRGFVNEVTKTSLAARGPVEELRRLLHSLRS